MRFTYHGHATFSLYTDAGVRLLFDPYFDNNPKFDGTHGDVGAVDFVLASHGHFDHFEDAVPVLKATGATFIATVELVSFAKTQGVEKIHGMNIGGAHDFPFGRVKLTPALHGGQVEGDDSGRRRGAGGRLHPAEAGHPGPLQHVAPHRAGPARVREEGREDGGSRRRRAGLELGILSRPQFRDLPW